MHVHDGVRTGVIASVLLGLFSIVGCDDPTGRFDRELAMWVRIESRKDIGITVSALIEDEHGMAVSGARVSAVSPSEIAISMPFDGDSGLYTGRFTSGGGGDFVVRAGSLAVEQPLIMIVPHQSLADGPIVNDVFDIDGRSAFSGSTLSVDDDVYVVWDSVPGATVYSVVIERNASPVWARSTTELSVVVPAGTLGEGAHLVTVEAQYLSGDIYLMEGSYYSASSARGSSVLFEMEDP